MVDCRIGGVISLAHLVPAAGGHPNRLIILAIRGSHYIYRKWVSQEVGIPPAGDERIVLGPLLHSLFTAFVGCVGKRVSRLI